MDIPTPWLLISVAIFTALSFLLLGSKWRRHRPGVRLPPGPYPLPVIGNLLQIGQSPHRSLAHLSKIYGPVMSLKMGNRNLAIVSSPEMAREVLTKHDVAFSGRVTPAALEVWDHHKYSLVGAEWRKLRKICKEHLFSTRKLEGSQDIRQDKLRQLYGHVKDCCVSGRAVNIEEAVFSTALNLMSATLFSLDIGDFGSDAVRELKAAVYSVVDTLSAPNLGDFFPLLKLIDMQGIKKRGELSIGKLLSVLEDVIRPRMLPSSSPGKDDMLQALLDLKNGKEYDISINDMKHLLLDLLVGGTDLLSTAVDWTMTELLLNPSKMAILRDELRSVLGKDKQVEESDISRLPYLRAVIKEALRYHPPGAILLPRKAEADTKLSNGYTILKDTQILINIWGMGRDSSVWSNPDSFEPERFLESNIEYEGRNFELLPFGSGRRMCPGMPLGSRMLHLLVAFLFHNFVWELEPGMTVQELDFSEKFGLSLRKKVPLKAVPSMHFDASKFYA